jgi:uncharacterized membrane protein
MLTLFKTGTYWVCHITVAFTLAFLLTGNWHAALAIGFLEPSVQAIVFYFHEIAWDRHRARADPTYRRQNLKDLSENSALA